MFLFLSFYGPRHVILVACFFVYWGFIFLSFIIEFFVCLLIFISILTMKLNFASLLKSWLFEPKCYFANLVKSKDLILSCFLVIRCVVNSKNFFSCEASEHVSQFEVFKTKVVIDITWLVKFSVLFPIIFLMLFGRSCHDKVTNCPVCWGCGIQQLLLYRWVRPPSPQWES